MDKIAEVKKQVQLREWAEMVRACRSSGISVRRWCMENGVNQKTYYYRLRKVREFFCEDHRDIVPVTCNIPVTAPADIKIQSGNMNITMPSTVSSEILTATIEALKC